MTREQKLDQERADELDALIEGWISSCECDACERYRKAFAHCAGQYAAQIEQQLKPRRAS